MTVEEINDQYDDCLKDLDLRSLHLKQMVSFTCDETDLFSLLDDIKKKEMLNNPK